MRCFVCLIVSVSIHVASVFESAWSTVRQNQSWISIPEIQAVSPGKSSIIKIVTIFYYNIYYDVYVNITFVKKLLKLLRLLDGIVDKLIYKIAGEHEDTHTDEHTHNSRKCWIVWKYVHVCEIPNTTPKEDDTRSHEKCLKTAFPEVSTSRISSKDIEKTHKNSYNKIIP